MRVHALLSWFEEDPDHLYELVGSIAPLADGVVAVDGAYGLYPGARARSGSDQYAALGEACAEHGLSLTVHRPATAWTGNEVEKRARMFALANGAATPHEDWFLIMDGDMLMCERGDPERARAKLADAGESFKAGAVTFSELPYGATGQSYDLLVHTVAPFRSLFRALPGLTVEWAHYFYNVVHADGSRDYLWYEPPGRYGSWIPHGEVAVVDVMAEVRLLHRPWVRERERVRAKGEYHARASDEQIEHAPRIETL